MIPREVMQKIEDSTLEDDPFEDMEDDLFWEQDDWNNEEEDTDD